MERLDDINPARIKWCLEDNHVSVEQFTADVGLSLATLERVMSREAGLTFNQLRKIGDYFGRTALFFLEEGPVDSAKVRSQEFRSLLNQKVEVNNTIKKVIQLAEWQREVFIDLVSDLEAEERIKFNPPSFDGLSVKQTAYKARAWLNIKRTQGFSDYRSAVEERGVLVFRSNGYPGKWQIPKESPVLGFSLYDKKHPLIVIKKQSAETRQSFTLAHELGHILLHKSSMIDDESDFRSHKGKEAAANQFAGYFLVPDEYLSDIDDADRPDDASGFDSWLSSQRGAWGVSTEVILIRLMGAGRLKKQAYAAYRQWLDNQKFEEKDGGNRGYRHREPRHILGDKYVRVVFDALERNKISLTKASKYLDDLKLGDLRELERYCASN